MEQTTVYNIVNFDQAIADNDARLQDLDAFLCPSDIEDRLDASAAADATEDWGRNSYRANSGSDTGQMIGTGDPKDQDERNNGPFVTNREIKLREITDGASNTAMFSEKVRGDGDDTRIEVVSDWYRVPESNVTADQVTSACQALNLSTMTKPKFQFSRGGRNWPRGNYVPSRYNHVLPPNGRSCTRSDDGGALGAIVNENGGATTASSVHTGGVNLVRVDGSVLFASETIELDASRAWARAMAASRANSSEGSLSARLNRRSPQRRLRTHCEGRRGSHFHVAPLLHNCDFDRTGGNFCGPSTNIATLRESIPNLLLGE